MNHDERERLHQQIMNIPPKAQGEFSSVEWAAYKAGHRDARHAAAELVAAPQHQWEFYANGSFCRRCGAQIGSGTPCR
jgi:hypothetical protein